MPNPGSRRGVRAGATRVVYVGGAGRSGSTLLERLLAELPGVVGLGEVGHLWERGLQNDELCACGLHFAQCPFWTEVGARAFGGWSNVEPEHVLELKGRVDRQRRVLRSAARSPGPELADDLEEYGEYYRRIYDAARALTGAAVVVDSSKVAPTALALSHHEAIDLRVLHIVRDSRGVAYSWSKSVTRPETEGREMMPRLSAASSTWLWSAHNLEIQALRYRRVPVLRLRYEDLVADPGPEVAAAWRALGLPGNAVLPLVGQTSIDLSGSHSVAGNPMRFYVGRTDLRPDTTWTEELSRRDRRTVTALTFPLLIWLGYLPARHRRERRSPGGR